MTKQQTITKKFLAEIDKEKQILKNLKGLYSIFSDYQYGGNRKDRMVKFVTGMIDGSGVSSVTEYLTALKMSIRITEREIGKLMVRYAMAKYVGKY